MILIGYHPTGAYKLYDPERNKVIISRDVVIDERKEWSWKQGSAIIMSQLIHLLSFFTWYRIYKLPNNSFSMKLILTIL